MVKKLTDKHLRAINKGRKAAGLKPIRRNPNAKKKAYGTKPGRMTKQDLSNLHYHQTLKHKAKNREKRQKENYPDSMSFDEYDDMVFSQAIQFADAKLNPATIVIEDRRERIIAAEKLADSINGRLYYQDPDENAYFLVTSEDRPDRRADIFEVVKLGKVPLGY